MNKKAGFNIDTACVDVYINKYAKKPKVSIYTPLIEDSLQAPPYANSQLQRLMEDDPLEYAEMVVNGTIDDYVAICSSEYAEQSKKLKTQLNNHYKDISETQIDSLAREYLMYD